MMHSGGSTAALELYVNPAAYLKAAYDALLEHPVFMGNRSKFVFYHSHPAFQPSALTKNPLYTNSIRIVTEGCMSPSTPVHRRLIVPYAALKKYQHFPKERSSLMYFRWGCRTIQESRTRTQPYQLASLSACCVPCAALHTSLTTGCRHQSIVLLVLLHVERTTHKPNTLFRSKFIWFMPAVNSVSARRASCGGTAAGKQLRKMIGSLFSGRADSLVQCQVRQHWSAGCVTSIHGYSSAQL